MAINKQKWVQNFKYPSLVEKYVLWKPHIREWAIQLSPLIALNIMAGNLQIRL